MGTSRKAATKRFHTLDGMRGVAALLVAMYHFGLRTNGMVPLGYLAVDLFLALSGFVIALNYERIITSGEIGVFAFMRMRLVRLYPLYVLGLAAGIAKQFARTAGVGGEDVLKGIWLPTGIVLGVLVHPRALLHLQRQLHHISQA